MVRVISVILLLLLGAARELGGVVLALRGPNAVDSDLADPNLADPNLARILGLGLAVVGVLVFVAAYGLAKRLPWGFSMTIAALVIFVLDGALNGYFLFGSPGQGGAIANLIAAVVIVGCVVLARSRGELAPID